MCVCVCVCVWWVECGGWSVYAVLVYVVSVLIMVCTGRL